MNKISVPPPEDYSVEAADKRGGIRSRQMKTPAFRPKVFIFFIIGVILLTPFAAQCRGAGGSGAGAVPKVAYAKPQDGSVVEVSGNESVKFEWHEVPMPSGGRDSFRFVLHRGGGYDVVVNKVLDSRVFSIEVPARNFEDATTYSWYIKQRDGRTLVWSEYDIWYFKVAKR